MLRPAPRAARRRVAAAAVVLLALLATAPATRAQVEGGGDDARDLPAEHGEGQDPKVYSLGANDDPVTGATWFQPLDKPTEKNPTLVLEAREPATLIIENFGNYAHTIVVGDPIGRSSQRVPPGGQGEVSFTTPDENTALTYYCSIHRQNGMEGTLKITIGPQSTRQTGADLELDNFLPGGQSFGLTIAFLIAVALAIGLFVFARRETAGARRPGGR